jgi:hypothetical protein
LEQELQLTFQKVLFGPTKGVLSKFTCTNLEITVSKVLLRATLNAWTKLRHFEEL